MQLFVYFIFIATISELAIDNIWCLVSVENYINNGANFVTQFIAMSTRGRQVPVRFRISQFTKEGG